MEVIDRYNFNAIVVGKCCYTGRLLFLAEPPTEKKLTLATTGDTIFTFTNSKDSDIVKEWIRVISKFSAKKNTKYKGKVVSLSCTLKYVVKDDEILDLIQI